MTSAEVLAKVRKLLELGKKTPYPGEAENALAAAQKLMLEHGVTEAQVDQSQIGYVTESAWDGTEFPFEVERVASLVGTQFFVEAEIAKIPTDDGWQFCIQFFGRAEHVAFAQYAFTFLLRTFQARWEVFRNNFVPALGKTKAKAFYVGLSEGFQSKLVQQEKEFALSSGRNESGALVVLSVLERRRRELEAAYLSRRPDITVHKARSFDLDPLTFMAGYQTGRAIDLRTPLGAPEKTVPKQIGFEKAAG